MKLVIDIPNEEYQGIVNDAEVLPQSLTHYERIIKNGTPLPKGHGRLIDISKIDDDRIDGCNPVICLTINGEYIEAVSLDYLNSLPPIIEADGGDAE